MPRLLGAALAAVLLAACAPRYQPMGPATGTPRLAGQSLVAADGAELPLRAWLPEQGAPRAVIVALHGLNDYSQAFDRPARAWARQGIATYAYDQRGFGAGPRPGIWAGADTLAADLEAAVRAVSARHPDTPLHLLGESMGGAVILAALTDPAPGRAAELAGRIDSAVLSAPALWGRQSMNPFYRAMLWLSARLVPGMRVEPPANLRITPSDNLAMLRSLGSDPRVLKRTRMDTLAGLVELMSRAEEGMARLPAGLPLLVLYGQNEEVLPRPSVTQALERWGQASLDRPVRVAVYGQGYHMLLRDVCARAVWHDVAAWVQAPGTPPAYGLGTGAWAPDKPKVDGPAADARTVACPQGVEQLDWRAG
ncbi:lysophospholipase [Orrella sp. JC864]|uniref:alpha/beta hydrolase n=1 Tax=Orrella sp. JC864 TaxID=3120298 RepID=UPI00300A82DA